MGEKSVRGRIYGFGLLKRAETIKVGITTMGGQSQIAVRVCVR